MGCKPCQDRWRIFLANESKIQDNMKKDKKEGTEEFTESVVPAVVNTDIPGKLDVEKLIAERRAKAESGKIINK